MPHSTVDGTAPPCSESAWQRVWFENIMEMYKDSFIEGCRVELENGGWQTDSLENK